MIKIENLFDQVKGLEVIGPRLSGEPEVLHEIADNIGYGMSRRQIQKVLEYVPSVFSEDWQSPEGYESLNDLERKAYDEITQIGPLGLPGPVIQGVIKLGVEFREKYQQKDKPLLPAGELSVIPTKDVIDHPDFMRALMAFQYGETNEESNQGFETLGRIARESDSEEEKS